ncbi:MAG TPA: hypothetical protein VNM69_22500 [Bacillus sp. (in: firmicutes)]|uniref:hypothetical protein n=1 Tax=Bacillus litorisediminis TaxID=2922713 RepID=UPI001FAFC889|nr:hypothetical protein [Bacillus litorisediminis]HWO78642.1 hypothetical protein [Bacillus sp. (in: firmicutes)]
MQKMLFIKAEYSKLKRGDNILMTAILKKKNLKAFLFVGLTYVFLFSAGHAFAAAGQVSNSAGIQYYAELGGATAQSATQEQIQRPDWITSIYTRTAVYVGGGYYDYDYSIDEHTTYVSNSLFVDYSNVGCYERVEVYSDGYADYLDGTRDTDSGYAETTNYNCV